MNLLGMTSQRDDLHSKVEDVKKGLGFSLLLMVSAKVESLLLLCLRKTLLLFRLLPCLLLGKAHVSSA